MLRQWSLSCAKATASTFCEKSGTAWGGALSAPEAAPARQLLASDGRRWPGGGKGKRCCEGAEDIGDRHGEPDRFPDDLFAMWALDTVAGLGFMRDVMKICHRDLKLGNILFNQDKFSIWVWKLWTRALGQAWGDRSPGLWARSEGEREPGRHEH